eukprot:9429355-Pyramimonas_sp.AAC.1
MKVCAGLPCLTSTAFLMPCFCPSFPQWSTTGYARYVVLSCRPRGPSTTSNPPNIQIIASLVGTAVHA